MRRPRRPTSAAPIPARGCNARTVRRLRIRGSEQAAVGSASAAECKPSRPGPGWECDRSGMPCIRFRLPRPRPAVRNVLVETRSRRERGTLTGHGTQPCGRPGPGSGSGCCPASHCPPDPWPFCCGGGGGGRRGGGGGGRAPHGDAQTNGLAMSQLMSSHVPSTFVEISSSSTEIIETLQW